MDSSVNLCSVFSRADNTMEVRSSLASCHRSTRLSIHIITRYSEIEKKRVQGLVNKMAIEMYTSEQAGGLCFNISHTNIKQLEEFSIRDMAHIWARTRARVSGAVPAPVHGKNSYPYP